MERTRWIAAPLGLAMFLVTARGLAIAPVVSEGSLHGFPVLRDGNGKKLADGDFTQWIEGGRLRVRLIYIFPDRRIEETDTLKQKPELVQEKWAWRETAKGKVLRRYEVDFEAGRATAEKLVNGELKTWSEKIDVEAGRTFGGFGLVLAIKNLREGLLAGGKTELKTVGFTPKPRAVSIEIAHAGLEEMRMADRVLRGDRFVIRPQIPRILKLFVSAPDTHVWLVNPPPAGFLRMEGPLIEPNDPPIRIDVLSGGASGPAKAVGR